MCVRVHGQAVQELPVLLHTLMERRVRIRNQLSHRVCVWKHETVIQTTTKVLLNTHVQLFLYTSSSFDVSKQLSPSYQKHTPASAAVRPAWWYPGQRASSTAGAQTNTSQKQGSAKDCGKKALRAKSNPLKQTACS